MKLRHYDHDGRARFVTFCTHRRIPLLTDNRFRRTIVAGIDKMRKEFHFRLVAYVIMPEHVHLVIIPQEEMVLGKVIGELKKRTAMEIHTILLTTGSPILDKLKVSRNGAKRFALWQKRCYDHNCRSETSVLEKVKYCHENPVKRGLVHSPSDWEWSSCRWYEGNGDAVLEIDSTIVEE
jgi:putative transposase